MKFVLIVIGRTRENYLINGIDLYNKRLKHYMNFEILELNKIKNNNLPKNELVKKEGEYILKNIKPSDYVILLDSKGILSTSYKFSEKLNKLFLNSKKRCVFVIGGAYGFSNLVYDRSNEKLSLSEMTFSHQIVRLLFLEQLYRACTIINNEPYHN